LTDDFEMAAARYHGGVEAPSPQSGTIFLSRKGIQFVYERRVNARGRIVGEEQQIFIRHDEIANIETDTERVVLGRIAGLSDTSVAGLAVELSDGRVAIFELQQVSPPQLIGALSRFGLPA
jgi:hypothetical protein